ncbi:hypothetical protein BZG36_05604 [Bifiguratus adelaidae]|uniref:Major facilitator superfamily (MFS) profile domain-containing protein n=1 Tax=Bifiguratus adelaidae TaxID=1938954 RepID=A0A261XTC9_9FUNG|nr:hypothetical protein BZG36_05604 [Bifiguratus adelaidae]
MEKEQAAHLDNMVDVMTEKELEYSEDTTVTVSARGFNAVVEKSNAEKRLVRKIDRTIFPLMCTIGFLQFMDKSALTYGAVLGMLTDVNLQGSQYSLLTTVFYIGYLCMQLPNSYLVQRFPIAKYLGVNICIWGMILACIGISQNFSQMAGLRFILGFFEGVVYPGFQLLTNTFYRKQEIQARNSSWIVMNGLAQALGGLIGYGIGHMEMVLNYHAWQWIMFIFGSATALFGIIVFVFLIDDPRSPRFNLTEEEKLIVEDRLRDNGVKRHQEWEADQFWEAIRDPKTYAFFLCAFLNSISSGGLNPFSTLIVQGLGFSGLNSILLNIPAGVVNASLILLAVLIHLKTNDILLVAIGMEALATLGLILLVATTSVGPRLFGYYIGYGYVATFVLMMTCLSSNTYGYTKKLFTQGIFFIGYTAGNAVGPLLMTGNQAPTYIPGMIGCIAANVLLIAVLFSLRQWMAHLNRKKAGNHNGTFIDPGEDITDLQYDKMIYKL